MKNYYYYLTILLLAFNNANADISNTNPSNKGWYLNFNTGYSVNKAKNSTYSNTISNNTKFDKGLFFGLGAGKAINNNIRIGIDYTYMPTQNFVDDRVAQESNINIPVYSNTAISSHVLMANLYYDIYKFENLTPYAFVGIGASSNRIDDVTSVENNEPSLKLFSNTRTNFAWNVGAGVNLKVSEIISFDFAYRFMHLGRVSSYPTSVGLDSGKLLKGERNTYDVTKIRANQFLVGLRVAL